MRSLNLESTIIDLRTDIYLEDRRRFDLGGKPDVVLSVRYCARCGGGLTSRKYEDGGMGILYETCDCPSCGLTWQIAQFPSGEVRIAEVPADEESPEEMIAME